MRTYLLSLLVIAACGKGKSDSGDKPGSATPDKGSDQAGKPPAKAGGSKFTYPPPFPGPHEGFDLAAIHKKLQGAWLLGGSGAGRVPTIWSLDGDTLTQIDSDGKRSTSTFRLLAPCYYVDGAADGSSGTYSHFAFDGDTLYLGLGHAGIVEGDRTIGCMSVAMYVLDKGTCTRWTKKSFSKPGSDEWEKEPGDCKYSDDKTKFTGDDTNSKRKIYGVETLDVKGKVLLTPQMANNKAEKAASLDAAIAKQKESLDQAAALKKTPGDLPFKGWGVESKAPAFAEKTEVWAAAVTRDGQWDLRTFRYKSFDNDALWLTGMVDAWAPSAFVHEPAKAAPNSPALLGIGALMPFGRVVGTEGDKLKVKYWQFSKPAETTLDAVRVLPIDRGWVFGAPIAYKKDSVWVVGRLVLEAGGDAYVFVERKVEKVAKDAVRVIDLAARHAKGAKVWAAPSSGMSLAFVEGTVLEVLADGLGYKVKTADKQFEVSFDRVIGKL